MTALEKPVFRVTRGAYPVLHHRKLRQVVVGLEPGDVVTFREKGRRMKWSLPVDQIFRMAVKGSAGFVLCMVPGPSLRKGKKGKR